MKNKLYKYWIKSIIAGLNEDTKAYKKYNKKFDKLAKKMKK